MTLRPPRTLIPPATVHPVVGDNRRRITELERAPRDRQPDDAWCLTAYGTGTGNSISSGVWRPWPGAIRIVHVTATFAAPTNGTVTVSVYVGSTLATSVTIDPAGTFAQASTTTSCPPLGELSISGSSTDTEQWDTYLQIWCHGIGGGHLPLIVHGGE